MSSGNPACQLPVSELLQVELVVLAHTEHFTRLQHLLPLPLGDECTRASAPTPEMLLLRCSRALPSHTAGHRAPTRFFPDPAFPRSQSGQRQQHVMRSRSLNELPGPARRGQRCPQPRSGRARVCCCCRRRRRRFSPSVEFRLRSSLPDRRFLGPWQQEVLFSCLSAILKEQFERGKRAAGLHRSCEACLAETQELKMRLKILL